MSTSSSQASGSLPLPGNIEGVAYKLISLEEAREQARRKQSEWLASSGASTAGKTSPNLASGDSAQDELSMQRDPSSDGQIKNKKSGFLLRKLKKEKGRFPSNSSFTRPKVAEIKPTPHGTVLPGPAVPGSAESNWSAFGIANERNRLPSLDAGTSSTDEPSLFHSPVISPLTPTFHHTVEAPASEHGTPALWTEDAATFSNPASPQIPDEVRQRARDIEAQIQELCNELNELRVKHVGQGTAPVFRASELDERQAAADCPSCGCACAEQRRLQSVNEAAVLKGVSVLDRGRALKPSSNAGKFGGYTNR
uniref:Uncharacterized protein n=1 Tax=Kalmanozyma brasiliensis (strain GHG001) TaxID=1365824 RepID=V5EW13_KALBG